MIIEKKWNKWINTVWTVVYIMCMCVWKYKYKVYNIHVNIYAVNIVLLQVVHNLIAHMKKYILN